MTDSTTITCKIITCPCQHCDGNIEFSSENFQRGMKHDCPHCGMETTLFIPNRMRAKPDWTDAGNLKLKTAGGGGNRLLPILCSLAVLFLAANCTISFLALKRSYAAPKPNTWRYDEFTFDPERDKPWLDINDKDGWHRHRLTVTFTATPRNLEISRLEAYTAGHILYYIGRRGWELAWTDGRRYIVRRADGKWDCDSFSITYKLDPEYKGPFKKD